MIVLLRNSRKRILNALVRISVVKREITVKELYVILLHIMNIIINTGNYIIMHNYYIIRNVVA